MADVGERAWKDLSIVDLKKFVDRKVNIVLCNNLKKVGWVHVIDPVTRTIVLVEQSEDPSLNANSLTFVLGHAVASVCVENGPTSGVRPDINKFLLRNEEKSDLSEHELQRKKTELMDWLKKNRVPVTESAENGSILDVMGVLFVEPPYLPESCRCANEIVLDRIQNLVKACTDRQEDDR